jgi:hypothetical protein
VFTSNGVLMLLPELGAADFYAIRMLYGLSGWFNNLIDMPSYQNKGSHIISQSTPVLHYDYNFTALLF